MPNEARPKILKPDIETNDNSEDKKMNEGDAEYHVLYLINSLNSLFLPFYYINYLKILSTKSNKSNSKRTQ